jgi:membrane protein
MAEAGRPVSLPRRIEGRIARAINDLYAFLARNRFTRLPWAVIQTFSEAEGALLSGSMAYYTFLSLLPLLMVTGFIIGTVSIASVGFQAAASGVIEQMFPGIYGRGLLQQLVDVRAALGVIGFITIAYAGSGFVGAMTACLNRMWRVRSGRNPVGQKIVNLLVVVILGVVLLGSVGLTLWVAYLTRVALGQGSDWIARVIELVASPISLMLVLLLLYRVLPARRLSVGTQLPGALFGAVGIELLKQAFTFWTQHSAGIEVLPRSLLSAVLLLVWLGLFGQVILYGAAINVVAERRRKGRSPFPPEAPH